MRTVVQPRIPIAPAERRPCGARPPRKPPSESAVRLAAAHAAALAAALLASAVSTGCSSPSGSDSPAGPSDAAAPIGDGAPIDLGDGAPIDPGDGGVVGVEPPDDASKPMDDAGRYPICDGGSVAADRFVTRVVSFQPGDCAGFGMTKMPQIVMGPPVGGGEDEGSLDVVSLGNRGSIVLSFEPNAIVDGPGPDFLVFENAFYQGGNPKSPAAEPGEVSVSDDGVTWATFPCTATSYPYGACAGWHPVLSNPTNCVSPIDPAVAGGDAFDLHDLGVTHARFVRIVDRASPDCPANPSKRLTTNGFDLDAIAIVNAEKP